MNSIVYATAGDAKSSSLTGFFNRPALLEDEVMIEVHAFGLNYADILSRKGVYPDAPGTAVRDAKLIGVIFMSTLCVSESC